MKKVKGIVLEIDQRNLILLTPGGDFIRVPHPGGKVKRGEEINCRPARPAWFKAAAMAACTAAAVFMLLTVFPPGSFFSGVPWSGALVEGYLVMDINPGLELAYDRNLKVTSCQPLNDDGARLLDGLPEGQSLDDTVARLLERAAAMGFLSFERADNLLLVTLVGMGEAALSPEPLVDRLAEKLNRLGISGYVGLFETDARGREEAVAAGLSLNRHLLMRALHRQGDGPVPRGECSLAELLRLVNGKFPGSIFRGTGKTARPALPGSEDSPGSHGFPPEFSGHREDTERGSLNEEPVNPGQDSHGQTGSGSPPAPPGATPGRGDEKSEEQEDRPERPPAVPSDPGNGSETGPGRR